MRLLYCSSVSPQLRVAGELLVYRHLSALEDVELMLAVKKEGGQADLNPAVQVFLSPPPRWIGRMRRGALLPFGEHLAARCLMKQFAETADFFHPDVVCSVMLPDSFAAAAAAYARSRDIPLVLFCHDDYEAQTPATRPVLAGLYRQAAARLCVSPAMEREFMGRYDVVGEVLPPIPSGSAVAAMGQREGVPIVGFAGSIGWGYARAMLSMADFLYSIGGKLVLASPTDRSLHPAIWRHAGIQDLGSLAPAEVHPAMLAAGVNVLGVVQSFAPADLQAFRFNFPSKMTEYITYGLPVIIVAPPSSSAVVWAEAHPDAALIVTSQDDAAITLGLRALQTAAQRMQWAEGFRQAGAEFDPVRLNAQFQDALTRSVSAAPAH